MKRSLVFVALFLMLITIIEVSQAQLVHDLPDTSDVSGLEDFIGNNETFRGRVHNVFDYLDGSSTCGIQEAFNAIDTLANGERHGSIYIPACNCSITTTIMIDSCNSVEFVGAGKNRTMIYLADSANCDMFSLCADSVAYIVTFRNMKLNGNKNAQHDDSLSSGLVNYRASELSLLDVEVRSFQTYNVVFKPRVDLSWMFMSDCYFLATKDGASVLIDSSEGGEVIDLIIASSFFGSIGARPSIEIDADANPSDVCIDGNRFKNGGIKISGGSDFIISDNIMKNGGNNDYFVYFDDRTTMTDVQTVITGNNIDSTNSVDYGVYIGSNVDGVDIFNNNFDGADTVVSVASGSNVDGRDDIFFTYFCHLNDGVLDSNTNTTPAVSWQTDNFFDADTDWVAWNAYFNEDSTGSSGLKRYDLMFEVPNPYYSSLWDSIVVWYKTSDSSSDSNTIAVSVKAKGESADTTISGLVSTSWTSKTISLLETDYDYDATKWVTITFQVQITEYDEVWIRPPEIYGRR